MLHFAQLLCTDKPHLIMTVYVLSHVAWHDRYSRGSLQVLNQLKLPHETEYVEIAGAEDAFKAIKTMMVRLTRARQRVWVT